MRIAFYAPMKSPEHAVPSGDRQVARGLVDALRARGHVVELASQLRTFDRRGDAGRQRRLAAIGARIAARLVARFRTSGRAPELWFTYHLHHKAPDVVGPAVCEALAIPYVVAEASVAPKQREGRWSIGYDQALRALRAADGVLFLNPVDVAEVRRVVDGALPCESLLPFLDVAAFRALGGLAPARSLSPVRLISVAMMRDGAKLASYRLLADALARIDDLDWELHVVGDGEARADVERAFARFGERVRFAGAVGASRLAVLLAASDVFVWPAIDEAFGMALLEAQACGLPVVAGHSGGVAAIVAEDASGLLPPCGDPASFATAVRRLVVDEGLRVAMGRRALDYVRAQHDLPGAAAQLDRFLERVRSVFAAGRQRAREAPRPC